VDPLCRSSLLQGSALVSLQRFFAALVQTNTPTASFEVLLKAVMGAGHECGTKQAGHSVALCVAGLCLAAGADKTQKTVQTLIESIKTPKGPADQVCMFPECSLNVP
jgi:cullin-associated NEDD8-dissociated protein 1